ncbi:MAG: hypothetical protein O9339_20625, partial [Rubrivivax sp.]|nr:hypothetical protein [Rubrivivax sp.]
ISAKCNTSSTAASTCEPSSKGWLAPPLRPLLALCVGCVRLNHLADQVVLCAVLDGSNVERTPAALAWSDRRIRPD